MQDLQMYTYTAPSYKETMEIAKTKHGEDALIVSSKEIRKKSLLENGLWEIVVVAPKQDAKDNNDNASNDELPSNSIEKRLQDIAQKAIEKKKGAKERLNNDIGIQISNAVKEIAKLTPNVTKRGIPTRDTNDESPKKSNKDETSKTREAIAKRNHKTIIR